MWTYRQKFYTEGIDNAKRVKPPMLINQETVFKLAQGFLSNFLKSDKQYEAAFLHLHFYIRKRAVGEGTAGV